MVNQHHNNDIRSSNFDLKKKNVIVVERKICELENRNYCLIESKYVSVGENL